MVICYMCVVQDVSSELYGGHMRLALGAVDRRVDEAREQVPISATMVRSDPYKYREFVSDIVYRRKETDQLFNYLNAMNHSVAKYHAGLGEAEP